MIFRHPLFWKEWKTVKWWCGLMTAMFLIMFLSVSHSLGQYQEMLLGEDGALTDYVHRIGQGGRVIEPMFLSNFNKSFESLVFLLVPIIVIMSIMLFQSDRKEGVGMFVSSLPFTKKEQFKVKWFVGILAFTIPFLLATVLTVIMRQANISWIRQWYSALGYDGLLTYDAVGLVMGILAQSYLFIVAFFSVLMLMQSLIGNNIAASLIGAIVVAVPWFILEAGGATLSRVFNNDSWRLYNIKWSNLYYFIAPDSGFILEHIQLGQNELLIHPVVSKEYYLIKIIILIAISVIAVYGGLKFYEKNDTSRNGYLLMFPWMKHILVPGVVLCSGLLGNNLIRQFIRIQSVPYEIITFVISALIGYLLMATIIKISEKHGG
ncbi:MAG TPA: hypothetical protein GX707_11295 [Epulopiscium sp.]|nr:hypothetical protein [Candidatus Epulonipiscium sp.]